MSEMSSKAKKLFDEFNYSQNVYHAYSASGTDNEYIEMKRKTRDAKRASFEEYVVGLESRITELEAERIEWVFEDQLPDGIPDAVYSAMYACSEVDFVRVFPSVTVDGRKRFLIELPEVQE